MERQPTRTEQRSRSATSRRVNVDSDTWQHEDSPGTGCSFMFPYLLCMAAYHLLKYMSKVYADYRSVADSWDSRNLQNFIIAAFCLISPTVIYSLYEALRVALSDENDPRQVLTKLVKGILLIPWQIKGHCEVLYFSSDRVCLWRGLDTDEKTELSRIKQEAFVLEFFVDFYSAFIHEILQLHLEFGSETQASYFQLATSSLSVLGIIAAFQRSDDGLLNKAISFIGWTSYCAARVVSLVLLWESLGGFSVLGAVFGHAIIATAFVYGIIKGVHKANRAAARGSASIAVLSFFLFGLPSLIYWPLMFVFKKKRFVASFLVFGIVENALCVGAWHLWGDPDAFDRNLAPYLMLAAIALTCLAVVFIVMYLCCKPDLTDQVVLSRIRERSSNRYGVYFDFCKAVRVLPDVSAVDRRRLQLNSLRPDLA